MYYCNNDENHIHLIVDFHSDIKTAENNTILLRYAGLHFHMETSLA